MEIQQAWKQDRRYVLDLAFRMLGSMSEAEDVVQEAFTRMSRDDVEGIDDARGWLIVTVTRRCLDQLRSARWSRVVVRDPLTDDFSALFTRDDDDPQDRVTLDEHVRDALLVLLERLSPAERTAFVLHDVFGLSFDEVATTVGRTPAACRQLASRARRTVQSESGPGRFAVHAAEQRDVIEQFAAACSTGDIHALVAVLDPDVFGQADLGGSVGLGPVIRGHEDVSRNLLVFLGPESGTTLVTLPVFNGPCLIAFRAGQPMIVVIPSISDGRIKHLHAVVDPEKLARWAPMLGATPG